MQKEIAVRLYQNAKYGTTYAKGVRHQALFNAAADIKNPKVKYVLDFHACIPANHECWCWDDRDLQLVGEVLIKHLEACTLDAFQQLVFLLQPLEHSFGGCDLRRECKLRIYRNNSWACRFNKGNQLKKSIYHL